MSMPRRFAAALATAAVAIATPAWAADEPSGTYQVKGWNPGTATTSAPSYTGVLKIKKVNDVYACEWTTPGSVNKGIGVIVKAGGKHVLAVGIHNGDEAAVAAYEIKDGGKRLSGSWAAGAQKAGHEEASQ